jgi:hypothetical protein
VTSNFSIKYVGLPVPPEFRYAYTCEGRQSEDGWEVDFAVTQAGPSSGRALTKRSFNVRGNAWSEDIRGVLARTAFHEKPPPGALVARRPLEVAANGQSGAPRNAWEWQELGETLGCLADTAPSPGPLRFVYIAAEHQELELRVALDPQTRATTCVALAPGGAAEIRPLPLADYKELRRLLSDVVMAPEPHGITDPPQPGFYLDDGRGALRAWSDNVSQDVRKDRLAACIKVLQGRFAPGLPLWGEV